MSGGRSIATNDRRAKFVELVADGIAAGKAAEQAGYAHGAQEAYRLLKDPEVVRAIQEASEGRSAGLVGVALSTCVRLMKEKYPPSVQLGAAKTILEHDRRLRQANDDNGLGDKPLDQMTDDQLMERLSRIRDRLRAESNGAPDDAPDQPQLIEHKG